MTKTKFILCDPNAVLQEEIKRRKNLRLLQVNLSQFINQLNSIISIWINFQVRELSKQNAAKLREAFKKEKDKQIQQLQNNLSVIRETTFCLLILLFTIHHVILFQGEFEQRKEEKIEELQDLVYYRMRHFGEGHQLAANYVSLIIFILNLK